MIMKKLYHYAPMVILTIFAALLLIGVETCAFIKEVMLSEDIYSEAIGKYGVSSAAYEKLVEYFVQYEAPTGIPSEVFTDVIAEEDITAASFKLTVDSIDYISGKTDSPPEVSYDFAALEESVTSYIEEYSEENGIEKDSEYYELIDNTISAAEAQITNKLDVMLLYTIANSSYAPKLNKVFSYIGYALSGFIALLSLVVILMLIVDRNHLRDMPYWLGTALFGSSVVILIPAVYLRHTGYFDSLFISTEHIYKAVTGLIDSGIGYIINAQIIAAAAGVLLIVLTLVIHFLYSKYREKLHEYKKRGGG